MDSGKVGAWNLEQGVPALSAAAKAEGRPTSGEGKGRKPGSHKEARVKSRKTSVDFWQIRTQEARKQEKKGNHDGLVGESQRGCWHCNILGKILLSIESSY